MNGKMILGIIALIGISAGIFCLVDSRDSKKDRTAINRRKTSEDNPGISHEKNMPDIIETAKENFMEDKTYAEESIKNRHSEAASEMKKSMNNIINANPIEQTKNTDTLNEMLDDIDKLIDQGDKNE